MANPSKQKGTRAETKVVRFLNDHGIEAARKALSGSLDKGDIEMTMPDGTKRILEVKAGKQTSNPNRAQLEEWLHQARVEEFNSGVLCALCIVRYNRKLKDADVYVQHMLDYKDGMLVREHMYLDEFCNWITEV